VTSATAHSLGFGGEPGSSTETVSGANGDTNKT